MRKERKKKNLLGLLFIRLPFPKLRYTIRSPNQGLSFLIISARIEYRFCFRIEEGRREGLRLRATAATAAAATAAATPYHSTVVVEAARG